MYQKSWDGYFLWLDLTNVIAIPNKVTMNVPKPNIKYGTSTIETKQDVSFLKILSVLS